MVLIWQMPYIPRQTLLLVIWQLCIFVAPKRRTRPRFYVTNQSMKTQYYSITMLSFDTLLRPRFQWLGYPIFILLFSTLSLHFLRRSDTPQSIWYHSHITESNDLACFDDMKQAITSPLFDPHGYIVRSARDVLLYSVDGNNSFLLLYLEVHNKIRGWWNVQRHMNFKPDRK